MLCMNVRLCFVIYACMCFMYGFMYVMYVDVYVGNVVYVCCVMYVFYVIYA